MEADDLVTPKEEEGEGKELGKEEEEGKYDIPNAVK